jgi:hypothetical protein
MSMIGKFFLLFFSLQDNMMNNMTLYPAHSDAQVAHAANAYLLLIISIHLHYVLNSLTIFSNIVIVA